MVIVNDEGVTRRRIFLSFLISISKKEYLSRSTDVLEYGCQMIGPFFCAKKKRLNGI